jgi:hypothetical protein
LRFEEERQCGEIALFAARVNDDLQIVRSNASW